MNYMNKSTIVHGIDSIGMVRALNLTNNRLNVNSSDRISNISTDQPLQRVNVANAAVASSTLTLRNNCVSILIDCGSKANFDGCAIVLSYSPDGTTYFADEAKVFKSSANGRYFDTFVCAFKAVKLDITNNTGGQITLSVSINNS